MSAKDRSINRKVSGRELRRTLQVQGNVAEVAYQNETVTRARLEGLEKGVEYLASVLGRGFWGRVRWVVCGR